jgi:hypothetical protein
MNTPSVSRMIAPTTTNKSISIITKAVRIADPISIVSLNPLLPAKALLEAQWLVVAKLLTEVILR